MEKMENELETATHFIGMFSKPPSIVLVLPVFLIAEYAASVEAGLGLRVSGFPD